MKKSLSFLAMSLLATCGLCITAQAEEYYEVNTSPDARAREYRQGEVIVKFKTESAVQVRRSAAGNFQSSGVSSLDNLMQQIGAKEIEPLMPLTGKLPANAPKRVKAYNGSDVEIKDMSKLYCLRIESGNVEDVVKELQAIPEVEFAEPNYIVYINSTPDDPLYSEQWGIPAVNADKLWDKPLITTKRPIIAILDTGIDITHPDLAANIWTNDAEANGSEGYDDDGNGFKDDLHGWDFVNQRGTIDDYNGHGTHCAGIAGAVGNNGIGICGANPDAWIMPVTVMQSDGTGDVATIIKGIDYAAANGADVISMSFGGRSFSIAEEQALARAYATAVLVAAAGNDGHSITPGAHCGSGDGPNFPAAFSFVLGVQANTPSGRAGFSSFDDDGPIYFNPQYFTEEQMYNYELSAPGTNITSTYPGGRYKALNGTSMACPLVAGAVSRLLSAKEYANKELLFGDLIHSAGTHVNFEACYDITDADRTPNVSLVTWRIEDETDNDGRFDAGETINFYATVRNEWGTATNVQTWIEIPELEAMVIKPFQTKSDFEKPLSSYAKAETANPFRFKVADDVVDGRHCRIMFYAQCDGMAEPYSQEIVFTAENGVEIGGMIEHDLTLEPGVSYIVTNMLAVPNGVTLTILPGAVLKFANGTGINKADNGSVIAKGTPENPIIFTARDLTSYTDFKMDNLTLNYVKISNFQIGESLKGCNLNNCEISNFINGYYYGGGTNLNKCNIIDTSNNCYPWADSSKKNSCNFNHNSWGYPGSFIRSLDQLSGCNVYANSDQYGYNLSTEFNGSDRVEVMRYSEPLYLGTGLENIARKFIRDIESGFGSKKIDLSNMLLQPNPECHGILWKVLVNGYDAQDEFGLLPPLGVGRHKFEVWYSKKIDESEAPFIAMGVRPPYTQTAIAENGSWRTETTRFMSCGNGVPEPFAIIHGDFENGFYNWNIENLIGESRGWYSGLDGFDGSVGYVDGKGAYIFSQTLPNIQNGKYRFKFKVKPDVLTEEGTQYIFANDDKTLVTSTDVATYEVITEVRKNKIEFGYMQEAPIESDVYFDDAELELLEEYPNGYDLDVSVYTAYLDIKGSMAIDGLNRIYVSGCKDLEYFDIPLENTRFKVEVAAAGSMSAGFMAIPGIGKVDLEWEDQEENVDDILGYNLYRTDENENTIRVNERLLDGTTYTDFDVVPGKRYDYYYKILRTSMEENSPSTVVSVVPLTAQKGDANGSLSVDVSDVVTEVSYITGGNPQPFIFDAADVNEDTEIDVLDIVGTVRIILYPDASGVMNEGTAKYWIKDGILWMDNDVTLGGVQFTLTGDPSTDTFSALEGLDGMEVAGAWNGNAYTLLAYSMSGRSIEPGLHPMLRINGGLNELTKVVASDVMGHNVVTLQADKTGMSLVEIAQMNLPTPNPFADEVTIPYVIGDNSGHRVELVMTDLTGCRVGYWSTVSDYGWHSYTWRPDLGSGIYMATLLIDGKKVQTAKLIKK